MRSPRSVTATPIGMFSRILKFAIAFFAFVTTGFWPVIVAMSAVADSTARAFSRASPRPMFTVTFCDARHLHDVPVAELASSAPARSPRL